jgi:hypothetical protein
VSDQAYRDLVAFLGRQFEGIDRRFDAIDPRFEAIDRRFDTVDERFREVLGHFDALYVSVFGSDAEERRPDQRRGVFKADTGGAQVPGPAR